LQKTYCAPGKSEVLKQRYNTAACVGYIMRRDRVKLIAFNCSVTHLIAIADIEIMIIVAIKINCITLKRLN
jgi:hypothetical protein